MGVAAGDFDNDGWVDLYLTKFDAPNQLLRNNGDGTFADVSRDSGTDHRSWSVVGGVRRRRPRRLARPLRRQLPALQPAGHGALLQRRRRARLLHARRLPAAARSALSQPSATARSPTSAARRALRASSGPALGVVDRRLQRRRLDRHLRRQRRQREPVVAQPRDGTFENAALLSGVALPVTGKAEASMGVDAGDFDDDGDDDLFVTELTGEGSNLFVNDGTGTFEDRSTRGRRSVRPAAVHRVRRRLARLRQRRPAGPAVGERHGADHRAPASGAAIRFRCTSASCCCATSAGAASRTSARRAGAAFALSEVGRGRGVRRCRQRRRHRRGRRQQQRPGAAADQSGGRRPPLGRTAAGRRGRARDARRARRDHPRAGCTAVAPGASRRQLRVGERSARARRPGRVDGAAGSPGDVAQRQIEMWAAVPIDRYTTLREGTGQ